MNVRDEGAYGHPLFVGEIMPDLDEPTSEWVEREIEVITGCSFISATSEEIRAGLGRRVQEDNTIAGKRVKRDEEITWCMHCGRSLTTTTYQGVMTITHPVWNDPHTGDHNPSNQLMLVPADYDSPQEMGLAIGKWIRYIHPPDQPPLQIFAPSEPAYTDAKPDPHLLETLKPLLGPHLEAIGVVLHITEIIGPMQQWTVTSEEDCGFEVEMTFRVTKTGGCFHDIQERRHIESGTARVSDMRDDSEGDGDHRHADRLPDSSGLSDPTPLAGEAPGISTNDPGE